MKVILVDDNADLVESVRLLLQVCGGYHVKCYLNAQDLLGEADSLEDDDILVSDYYLPDLNGLDLIKRLRRKRPRLRAMLLTGSREDGIARAARTIPGCTVVYKPLDYEELDSHIKKLAPGKM